MDMMCVYLRKMTKMFAFNRKVVFLQNRNVRFGNVYFYF